MRKKDVIAVVVNNVDFGRGIIRALKPHVKEEFKIITPLTSLVGYHFDGWIDLNGLLLQMPEMREELLNRMKKYD